MRDALATWHMGRVIFAYRTHPWHVRPLSQETVGNWLGLTQAQLSRIENGRAPEELSKLVRYAQILHIPAELLWFKLPDDSDTAAATSGTSCLTLPVVIRGRPVLLPIDVNLARRHGLDDLIDELGEHGQPLSGATAHALPPNEVQELEHVAAALDDARQYLDGSVVGYFREQLDRSKSADGDLGPAKALPFVLGVLGTIAQHVREVKPEVRCALLSLGADGAEFAGWLYRDLQDPASTAAAIRGLTWGDPGWLGLPLVSARGSRPAMMRV